MTIDRSQDENDDGPPRDPPSSQIGHNSRIVAPVLDRRLADLKFMPGNPRVHTKAQLRKLELNLRTYGFVGAIIIDNDDFIVAGEAIAKAARAVGYEKVPTICPAHLTDLQVKAFRIAHNRLAELSRWDDQALGEDLKILMDAPTEIVIETLGFELPEIDFRIESLSATPKAEDDPADLIPLVSSKPAVTQLNDVWLVGRHKILCGNAVDASSFARLMLGELAAMVLSDPPWNLPNDGFTGGLGMIHHANFMMAAGEMSDAEFAGFLIAMLQLMMLHSTDGALIYIFMDWRHLHELLGAGKALALRYLNLCVWVKHNGGMGSHYRSQHECVVVFKHGVAPHRNNIELGKHGRNRTNVWHYDGMNSFGRTGEEGNLLAMHPTAKPVKMVADALLDSSARGDIVLDPFLGSGTTLMAAERTGRVLRGIELDPLYVDVAICRWQAMTGDDARHAESGLTFNEIAATRETDNV